ncbi:MAG: DUF2304 domain-containing protein [Parasporobacterium sp.]|nr:DUF2304 domain-containing protein [Parasporobacterium sp.]
MALGLRIVLMAASVITAFFVIRKIRKAQFTIGDTLFWLVFCLMLLVLSIFPSVSFAVSEWLGFQSNANFIFLLIIFLLLIKIFLLDAKVSTLQGKLIKFAEKYAIDHKKEPEDSED